MTKRIYVAPAAGKRPRSPLPPYDEVPTEGYVQLDQSPWRRLERFGDVVITDEAPAAADDAPAAPRKSK